MRYKEALKELLNEVTESCNVFRSDSHFFKAQIENESLHVDTYIIDDERKFQRAWFTVTVRPTIQGMKIGLRVSISVTLCGSFPEMDAKCLATNDLISISHYLAERVRENTYEP